MNRYCTHLFSIRKMRFVRKSILRDLTQQSYFEGQTLHLLVVRFQGVLQKLAVFLASTSCSAKFVFASILDKSQAVRFTVTSTLRRLVTNEIATKGHVYYSREIYHHVYVKVTT